MLEITSEEYELMVGRAMDALAEQMEEVRNVAIVIADYPNEEQRKRLNLHANQTLYGLYEGVPLPSRGGSTSFMPDKITLFKGPMVDNARDRADLQQEIHHTLWHELAHHFGLDHAAIRSRE